MQRQSVILSDEKRKLFERFWEEEQAGYREDPPKTFWPPEFEQDQNLFREYRRWSHMGPWAAKMKEFYQRRVEPSRA
ncbi:MAG: hypothetical protein ACOYCD_01025 [Kiritimatiellia bacterium]|jgi:hypothetical protein